MTSIQEQRLTDLCRTLQAECTLHASIEGRLVRVEERNGSHIKRTLLIHPANHSERIGTTFRDAGAICKDAGVMLKNG